MRKSKLIRLFKKFHKWPGIIIAFFAILYASSGILLNHRVTFSNIDISRKLMPPGYQYKNWNLAAIKGSLPIGNDSLLIYGNVGIWLTNNQLTDFEDFNSGFPRGIDNRKIYSIKRHGNRLVAATHFGLFTTPKGEINWQKTNLPVKETRLTDLAIKQDTLLILTRNHLLKTTDFTDIIPIKLNDPIGYNHKIGLFITLWELHSGELFGILGRWFVDILGFTVIWLSVSGLLHFFFPKWIRKRKRKKADAKKLVSAGRWNLHWHNNIGYWAVAFLLINTIAGMFLRPPLLIPIASNQVGKVPFSHLDNDNAWHDKLRRVTWNDSLNAYIFSTSEGFFVAEEALDDQLIPVPVQPPVSVMGLNVFESLAPDTYLVGSFSGLFIWNIRNGSILDYYTGKPTTAQATIGRPISNYMVTGWVETTDGKAWWFDYNKGAIGVSNVSDFPQMTPEIVKKTPTSLWNASLEVHTGRIFEHLIGQFYILIVPLAGLCIVTVLISGFFIYRLAYRKKKK